MNTRTETTHYLKKFLYIGLFTYCFLPEALEAVELRQKNKLYHPQLNVGATYSDVSDLYPKASIFLPLVQNNYAVLFTDFSVADQNKVGTYANLGLGYRQMNYDETWLWGVNSYYTKQKSQYGHDYQQLGLGVQWRNQLLSFAANAYIPMGKKVYYEAAYQRFELYKLNSSLSAVQQVVGEELALHGYDAELGMNIPGLEGLSAYAGAYHYQASDAPTIAGPKLGMQYKWNPASDKLLGWFDEIRINGSWQQDQPRGSNWAFALTFSISLGGHNSTSGLAQYMTEPVRRNPNILNYGNTEKQPEWLTKKNNENYDNESVSPAPDEGNPPPDEGGPPPDEGGPPPDEGGPPPDEGGPPPDEGNPPPESGNEEIPATGPLPVTLPDEAPSIDDLIVIAHVSNNQAFSAAVQNELVDVIAIEDNIVLSGSIYLNDRDVLTGGDYEYQINGQTFTIDVKSDNNARTMRSTSNNSGYTTITSDGDDAIIHLGKSNQIRNLNINVRENSGNVAIQNSDGASVGNLLIDNVSTNGQINISVNDQSRDSRVTINHLTLNYMKENTDNEFPLPNNGSGALSFSASAGSAIDIAINNSTINVSNNGDGKNSFSVAAIRNIAEGENSEITYREGIRNSNISTDARYAIGIYNEVENNGKIDIGELSANNMNTADASVIVNHARSNSGGEILFSGDIQNNRFITTSNGSNYLGSIFEQQIGTNNRLNFAGNIEGNTFLAENGPVFDNFVAGGSVSYSGRISNNQFGEEYDDGSVSYSDTGFYNLTASDGIISYQDISDNIFQVKKAAISNHIIFGNNANISFANIINNKMSSQGQKVPFANPELKQGYVIANLINGSQNSKIEYTGIFANNTITSVCGGGDASQCASGYTIHNEIYGQGGYNKIIFADSFSNNTIMANGQKGVLLNKVGHVTFDELENTISEYGFLDEIIYKGAFKDNELSLENDYFPTNVPTSGTTDEWGVIINRTFGFGTQITYESNFEGNSINSTLLQYGILNQTLGDATSNFGINKISFKGSFSSNNITLVNGNDSNALYNSAEGNKSSIEFLGEFAGNTLTTKGWFSYSLYNQTSGTDSAITFSKDFKDNILISTNDHSHALFNLTTGENSRIRYEGTFSNNTLTTSGQASHPMYNNAEKGHIEFLGGFIENSFTAHGNHSNALYNRVVGNNSAITFSKDFKNNTLTANGTESSAMKFSADSGNINFTGGFLGNTIGSSSLSFTTYDTGNININIGNGNAATFAEWTAANTISQISETDASAISFTNTGPTT